MSGITGGGVKTQNPILRFCLIIFLGIVGLGLALSWRATAFVSAEYQDLPQSQKMIKIKNSNLKFQQKFKKSLEN